jgi:hypothetical protein
MMKLHIMHAARRKTKAIACASFLLLLCAALSFAQSSKIEPDKQKPVPVLGGTWVLDEEQPKQSKQRSAGTHDKVTLVISQHEPEIKMTRKVVSGGQERTRESVYYSDERGETNTGATISTTPNPRDEEIKSRTRWRGDKLVTTTTVRKATAGTLLIWDIIDEWKLSPDGKTLTQTTIIKPDNSGPDIRVGPQGRPFPPGPVIYVPANGNRFKRVFRRVSD